MAAKGTQADKKWSKKTCYIVGAIVILATLWIGVKIGKHAAYHHSGYGAWGSHHRMMGDKMRDKHWRKYGRRWADFAYEQADGAARPHHPGFLLKFADSDDDNNITREEFNQLFDRFDRDGNGIISNEYQYQQ